MDSARRQRIGRGGLWEFYDGWLAWAGTWPDPYWLIFLLAFLPLLPVAQLVNQLNAQLRPSVEANSRFSGANVTWAAVCGVILLMAIAEMVQ